MIGKIYFAKGPNLIKYNHIGNWYYITFSYWDFYFDGITRLECGFFGFLKHLWLKNKCQIHISRWNMKNGAGQIGRLVWEKTFNG